MIQKQRDSNIELLRIIAMVMIVAHHFSVRGGFAYDLSCISINRVWIQFLQLGGKVGVDVFVLISGYYLVTSKSLSTFKALKLWFQMLFYSVVFFVISLVLGFNVFSKKAMLDTFFPVSMSQWWFASTYFILFLFSPFINIALTAMSKKTYQRFLLLAIILWCVFPSITRLYPKFTSIAPQMSFLTWFVTLYALAAYIRLWHPSLRHTSKYYLAISVGAFMLTLLSAIILDYLDVIQKSVVFSPTALFEMTSITILVASVSALLGFLQIDMPYSKVINTIASASFGVYLLHEQVIMQSLLWVIIFKNSSYANSNMLIPYSIAVIFFVYLGCTCIDLIRIKIIERPFLRVISKMSKAINSCFDKLFSSSLSDRL